MKLNLKTLLLCTALSMPVLAIADSADEALSAKFKSEIKIKQAELNLEKTKLKSDKKNAELIAKVNGLKEELQDLKRKKDIIDDKISAEKEYEKAVDEAEKAKKKLETAVKKANETFNK